MKYFLSFILILFSLISFSFARSGCCSWHGGVCGNSCCDGSPLSAKCGGGSYYYKPIIIPKALTMNEKCNIWYPGTIYRESDTRCACKGDPKGTSTRNSNTKSCLAKTNSSKISTNKKKTLTMNEKCNIWYPGTIYRESDTRCACKGDSKGISTRNSNTKSCPSNSEDTMYKSTTTNTTVNCPINSVYSSYSKLCICDYGYIPSSDKNSCIKEQIETNISETPQPDINTSSNNNNGCRENSHLNSWGDTCYCDYGYKMNYLSNTCEKVNCPSNAHLSSSLGDTCYCDYGYKMNYSSNTCEKVNCPSNAHLSSSLGDTCYCDYGYKMNYLSNTCEKVN